LHCFVDSGVKAERQRHRIRSNDRDVIRERRQQPEIFILDVIARDLSLRLDQLDVAALVGCRTFVEYVRDRLQSQRLHFTFSNELIGETDDGGAVETAAQLRKDRTIRSQPAAYCFTELLERVFLILLISAVFDDFRWIEPPVSLATHFSCRSHCKNVSRFYTQYVFVWRKLSDRTKTHRAGNVFFIDLQGMVFQCKQRRHLSRPGNPVTIDVILESACARYITYEIKDSESLIPECKAKVAN